jgi:hypothetical protein
VKIARSAIASRPRPLQLLGVRTLRRVRCLPMTLMLSACTGGAPKPAAVSSSHDSVRVAIATDVLSRLSGAPSCLAIDVRIRVADSSRPSPMAATSILTDPTPEVFARAKRKSVVPMSQCPEPRHNLTWYHVWVGPLTVLRDGRIEPDVTFGLDGFPTVDRCVASPNRYGWWDVACRTVWQA